MDRELPPAAWGRQLFARKDPERRRRVGAYDTRVVGHLTVTPPLLWSEIKQSRFYAGEERFARNLPDVVLQVESAEEETERGVNSVITARFIVPCTEAQYPIRTLESDVEEIYEAFPGHEVRGELVLWGEDYGDIRRLVVDGDGVRIEKARVVWPDGSEVKLS